MFLSFQLTHFIQKFDFTGYVRILLVFNVLLNFWINLLIEWITVFPEIILIISAIRANLLALLSIIKTITRLFSICKLATTILSVGILLLDGKWHIKVFTTHGIAIIKHLLMIFRLCKVLEEATLDLVGVSLYLILIIILCVVVGLFDLIDWGHVGLIPILIEILIWEALIIVIQGLHQRFIIVYLLNNLSLV